MRTGRVWSALLISLLIAGVAATPAPAQPAGRLLVGLVAEPVNLDPPQVTDLCGIGSWGGQRLSMGDYVTEMGATMGATAAGAC
jgi:hypothetical protein